MQADNQSCCFPSRMVVRMQIHDDSNEIYHMSSFFRTLAAKTIGLGLCHYGIRRQLFLRTTGPGSNPGRRRLGGDRGGVTGGIDTFFLCKLRRIRILLGRT